MSENGRLRSYTISQGRERAGARAMLKGIGFTDEDLAKPIIGVANTWIETMPCNYNLRDLAVKVKEAFATLRAGRGFGSGRPSAKVISISSTWRPDRQTNGRCRLAIR